MAKMKLKTHSGAKKRFKLTKNGKIKRGHAFRSHILTKKTTKLPRGYRQVSEGVDKGIALFISQLQRIFTGLVIYIAVQDNLRPVIFSPFHLDQRGGGRHYDH